MKNTVIIFDLDGTLLDTSLGIFASVRFAEKQMGLLPIDKSKLPLFIGPPPKEMYSKIYGLTEDEALKAVAFHREYGLKKAIYDAHIYEGIPDVLIALRKNEYKLAVATLKKQAIAELILENFDLTQYFDSIVGMNNEETISKKDTIELAIKNTDSLNAIMVGDSEYDYVGASAAGIGFVGVLYGFGFDRNVKYNFPVVNNPLEILEIVEQRMK